MPSDVLYDAPSDYLAAEQSEPSAPTYVEPEKGRLMKRVHALFACELLLIIMSMAIVKSSSGYGDWYNGQQWLRLFVTIGTILSAAYVVKYPRPSQGALVAAIAFSLGQAVQFGYVVAVDRTQLLPNVLFKTFGLAVAMTIGSIMWPTRVLHVHTTLLASKYSMPLVWAMWLLLMIKGLQLVVVMFGFGLFVLALLTYYTPVVIAQYVDEQWLAAAVELYYSVIMRVIMVLVGVCVVVDRAA